MKKIILNFIIWPLLFSIPTHFQIENDFKPLKQRFNVDGKGATQFALELSKPQTIRFTLDFAIKTKQVPDEGLSVFINNRETTYVQAKDFGLWHRTIFNVPPDYFSGGANIITLKVAPESASYFNADIKAYNYKGSSPRFPKVFVVFDSEIRTDPYPFTAGEALAFLKTFLAVLASFSLCHLIIHYGFYNRFVDSLPATARIAGLITPIPWISLAYGSMTPYQIIFPYETACGIIIISFIVFYALGIFLSGIFFTQPVDFLLPGNIRGNQFPKRLITAFHNKIIQVIETKYSTFWLRGSLAALTLLPIVAYGYYIFRYSINIPFMDDFMVFSIVEYLGGDSSLSDKVSHLLSIRNQHIQAVYRLTMEMLYLYQGEINFKAGSIVGNMAMPLLLILFYKIFPPCKNKLFYYLPVVPFLLCLNTWTIITKPIGPLSSYYVHCFAGFALYFLTQPQANMIASGLFATLGTLTRASGMAVFPCGFLLLLSGKYHFRNAVWILISAFNLYLYFHTFVFPDNPAFATESADPIKYAIFYFALLGSPIAFNNIPIAVPAGLSIFIYMLFLTRKKYYQTNPMIYFFMVFIFLVAALITSGRVNYGIGSALSSRYQLNAIVLIILTYMSLIDLLQNKMFRTQVLLGWYACILAFMFNIMTTREYLPRLQDHTLLLASELKAKAEPVRTGENLLKPGLIEAEMLDALKKNRYKLPCDKIFPGENVKHQWCE